jgi:hypothetical protein
MTLVTLPALLVFAKLVALSADASSEVLKMIN